jgi:hypothetical protein
MGTVITKKAKLEENIYRQGMALMDTFNIEMKGLDGPGPVTVYKLVKVIEDAAHRHFEKLCSDEHYCNVIMDTEEKQEAFESRLLVRLDKILDYTSQGIPVFLNQDPRGHALKLEGKYYEDHSSCRIPRDWGGDGMLCPDFHYEVYGD